MVSSGTIPYKEVVAMLEKCAKGHKRKSKTHLEWITYKGSTYKITRGKHSSRKRKNFRVEIGHVRSLVRMFSIGNCAKKVLSQL